MSPKQTDTPTPETTETEGWRPEPGDVLSGKIVNVSRAWSDWTNSFYPLITVHDEQRGDVDVHAFHHTLKSRLMEVKPKVGDEIEIAYIGKRATKDEKREVAIYRVTVPGADGQQVWDSLERQDATAARSAVQGELPTEDDIPF